MIVCAGKNENFSFAKTIGIGLVESSINLTKLILEKKPKNLLFIGSAGSYGKAKIGESICTNVATNIEIGYFEKLSYSPKSECFNGIKNNVSHETLANLIVNSSNYITSNKAKSEIFRKNGLDIENMEFFSILSVGQQFNIQTLGLFYITNYCFENAHMEFIKNHEKAKETLEIEVVKNFKEYF
jgi:nucleoside phosphorylase